MNIEQQQAMDKSLEPVMMKNLNKDVASIILTPLNTYLIGGSIDLTTILTRAAIGNKNFADIIKIVAKLLDNENLVKAVSVLNKSAINMNHSDN